MTDRSAAARTSRRPESQPEPADVAAVFERRLLARGIRSDDFLDWRGSAELPPIPDVKPVRFGRSAPESILKPLAPIAAEPNPDPTDADPL